MVSVSGLSSMLSIVSSAMALFSNDKAKSAIKTGAKYVGRSAASTKSLTAWTTQTTIMSRVFIDESVLSETVIPNFMRQVHEWYAAQIIAALQLTQMVDSARTVQDVMSVVQSGHSSHLDSIVNRLAGRRVAQESFLENYHGKSFSLSDVALEAYGHHGPPTRSQVRQRTVDTETVNKLRSALNDEKELESKTKELHDKEVNLSSISVKSVKGSDNRIGPMGELFEIKLVNPNTNQSIIVPVFVQLAPSIVPQSVAPRFIDLNVPHGIWQRWTMWRAGEITFWKDFLFHRQHLLRQKAISKDPETAKAFNEYLRTLSRKDTYALLDITDSGSRKQSSNLANSVVIFSEDTVKEAKLDSGIDLHNPEQRQQYFNNTYTMILAIIDPIHQRITTYFNGLDGEHNTSYNEFKSAQKNLSESDLVTTLQAFSSNSINRMR